MEKIDAEFFSGQSIGDECFISGEENHDELIISIEGKIV